MDSEVQRLRLRVRQLEREVRALRTSAHHPAAAEPESDSPRFPPPLHLRRRILNSPVGGTDGRSTD